MVWIFTIDQQKSDMMGIYSLSHQTCKFINILWRLKEQKSWGWYPHNGVFATLL